MPAGAATGVVEYVLKRFILIVPTIVAISVIVFFMLYLTPGDPAIIYLGDTPATPERLAQIRHAMGLDRSLMVQYVSYIARVAKGDLGRSLRTAGSVLGELEYRAPSSAELAVAAFSVTLVPGTLLGLVSGAAAGAPAAGPAPRGAAGATGNAQSGGAA